MSFGLFVFGPHLISGTKPHVSMKTLFWSSLDLLKSLLNVCHLIHVKKKSGRASSPPMFKIGVKLQIIAPNAQHKSVPLSAAGFISNQIVPLEFRRWAYR